MSLPLKDKGMENNLWGYPLRKSRHKVDGIPRSNELNNVGLSHY